MSQIRIKGILSYPHLFTPRAVQQGDTPKYSVSVLIPKNDPQIAVIQAAIESAKANGFPSGFPPNGKVCMKDCAMETSYNADPRYHNYMVISANNTDKPPVVDTALQPVMDASMVFAGCIADLSIGVATYNSPLNKGVGAYVNGVMVAGEEGPLGRIDGRPTVEQMFGAPGAQSMPTGMPATAPGVPGAPVAPVAPPPVAPPAAPALQMTAAANGNTYEQMIAVGWTDQTLLDNGMAQLPSFV